jgi:hypothetical protein
VSDNRLVRLRSLWLLQQSDDQDILSRLLVLLPIPSAAGGTTFFTTFLTPFLGRPRLLFSPLVVAATSSFAGTDSLLVVFCFLRGGFAVASVLSAGTAVAALSRFPPALGLVSLFFSADPCAPVSADASFCLAWFGCTWRFNISYRCSWS